MSLRNRVNIPEKYIYCLYHTDEVNAARYLFGKDFDKSNFIKIVINNEEIDISKLLDANGAPGGWRYRFPTQGDYHIKFYLKDDVENLDYMFYDVDKLVTCDFYNFNKNNIKTMIGMFQECGNVTHINFRNFNARTLENISNLFNACPKLINVNFGKNFRTYSLSEAYNVFNNCQNIITIDMRYLYFGNCDKYNKIWANCTNLTKLYLNTPIKGGSDLSYNAFYNSNANDGVIYLNTKQYNSSLFNDIKPSNWTIVDFNSYEDL